MTATDDDEPPSAEDLVRELMKAGASERWARLWVTSPTGLLSGLRPGDAIANPATADRARTALRRQAAQLPEPIPAGVYVTGARIRDEGTYMVELTFAWPSGIAVRHWDAEPYLAASRAHEVLLTDYERFTELHVADRTLSWPGDLDFAPEFLYGESWPAGTPGPR
ncbi:hypothetical protein ACNKF0_09505 [Nocardioides sp. T5]|uniref:hypothetical protein n=1 Tax=Nocardioides sp. T5 TaxID=3400182 RepID=UPI003A837258